MTDTNDLNVESEAHNSLLQLFTQAAKLASTVPESMQEAAFEYALEQLSGDARQPVPARPAEKKEPGPKPEPESVDADKAVQVALQRLDRTKYPRVGSAAKVLDNSLWVLRAVKDDLGVDGLSPSQVGEILTEKFRVSTTPSAVNMALGRAGNMVDRVPRGRGFAYRVMAPGEAYLDSAPR